MTKEPTPVHYYELNSTVYSGFSCGSVVKNLSVNSWDRASTPGSGRSPEEGMGYSSILAWKISLDRGTWWATVQRVAESRTRLSMHACHSLFRFHKLFLHVLSLGSYPCYHVSLPSSGLWGFLCGLVSFKDYWLGTQFEFVLEGLMDRGAWQATVHQVTKSWIWPMYKVHIQRT